MGKINIREAMYNNALFNEPAGTCEEGTKTLKVNERVRVNGENVVPARIASGTTNSTIGVGRNAISCEISPAFKVVGYDPDGKVYGEANVRGFCVKWMCDGSIVKTNLPNQEEANLTFYDYVTIGLFPAVAWYEPQDEDTKDFRENYQNGKATATELCRYCDAFYFSPQVKDEIDVITGCPDSECVPSGAVSKGGTVQKSGTASTMLPWNSVATSGIPNDFSVESARKGKYLLPGQWGRVTEGNNSHDFANDIIPLEFLDGYVDNPVFRSVLSQFVYYISSLFRANKLDDDASNGAINTYLASRGVTMKTSILQNIMLAGGPGTGKTMLMSAISATLGLPIAVIRISRQDERDVLTEAVAATVKGFVTIPSEFVWYVSQGGIIVLDDITNADANMLFSVVGGLLEAPYQYRVGENTVRRNPLTLIAATANIGTRGSQQQNEALLTRFSTHEVVEKLDDDEFKACISRRAIAAAAYQPSKKSESMIIDWVYKVFTLVKDTVDAIDKPISDQLITLRSAISLCEMILDAKAEGITVNAKELACKVMGNILYTGGQAELQVAICSAIRGLPDFKI